MTSGKCTRQMIALTLLLGFISVFHNFLQQCEYTNAIRNWDSEVINRQSQGVCFDGCAEKVLQELLLHMRHPYVQQPHINTTMTNDTRVLLFDILEVSRKVARERDVLVEKFNHSLNTVPELLRECEKKVFNLDLKLQKELDLNDQTRDASHVLVQQQSQNNNAVQMVTAKEILKRLHSITQRPYNNSVGKLLSDIVVTNETQVLVSFILQEWREIIREHQVLLDKVRDLERRSTDPAKGQTECKEEAINLDLRLQIEYDFNRRPKGWNETYQPPQDTLRETSTTPIDMRYIDEDNKAKSMNPRLGTLSENGTIGYVLDPTALHQNPPDFVFQSVESACRIRDDIYRVLKSKVTVASTEHNATTNRNKTKIFCAVYTTESMHTTQIPAIRETWGNKCDGFMFGSNKTDSSVNAVHILHNGEEEYKNMWQKVRSMWAYIYDNFYDEYDWFYMGGDDMYVIVENLKMYVESDEIRSIENRSGHFQTPLYLGERLMSLGYKERLYNTGGPGYVLNKAALKLLVISLPHCGATVTSSMEDVWVANCLKAHGVYPYDTRDNQASERFHHFVPHEYFSSFESAPAHISWLRGFRKEPFFGKLLYGYDRFARYSVGFHQLKEPDLMRRVHAILYDYC